MITAIFSSKQEQLTGFEISGHAEFDEYGSDIVCSAVTSAVQMCCNTITEILKMPADVQVRENIISLQLQEPKQAQPMLKGLLLHFETLQKDYKDNIQVKLTEV